MDLEPLAQALFSSYRSLTRFQGSSRRGPGEQATEPGDPAQSGGGDTRAWAPGIEDSTAQTSRGSRPAALVGSTDSLRGRVVMPKSSVQKSAARMRSDRLGGSVIGPVASENRALYHGSRPRPWWRYAGTVRWSCDELDRRSPGAAPIMQATCRAEPSYGRPTWRGP